MDTVKKNQKNKILASVLAENIFYKIYRIWKWSQLSLEPNVNLNIKYPIYYQIIIVGAPLMNDKVCDVQSSLSLLLLQ